VVQSFLTRLVPSPAEKKEKDRRRFELPRGRKGIGTRRSCPARIVPGKGRRRELFLEGVQEVSRAGAARIRLKRKDPWRGKAIAG